MAARALDHRQSAETSERMAATQKSILTQIEQAPTILRKESFTVNNYLCFEFLQYYCRWYY